MNKLVKAIFLAVGLASIFTCSAQQPNAELQFVLLSDVHYGIERANFRGAKGVDANVVNAALVARLNALPAGVFPKDGGLRASQAVGAVDFVSVTGDVANRMEAGESANIQSAAVSWSQFAAQYLGDLKLPDRSGGVAPLFVVPGNHDASNAVGHFKLAKAADPTSMIEIYNRMMRPAVPLTSASYRYTRDVIRTSRDISGVHLVFITVWPDAATRAWLEKDLAAVNKATPVFIFAHDPPDSDAKHFVNPNGAHDVNENDKFENLLGDVYADGPTAAGAALKEQQAFEQFLKRHPNITAYFHGHSNFNQFYDWTGPEHSVVLHTFRVDSPMKGAVSAADETKLSFQVATVDLASRTLTVRECLWNADPAHPAGPLVWGASTTVAFAPRPVLIKAKH